MCWYAKCTATVRWGTECSNAFLVVAGVRQGGVLSPTLFAIYMDYLIYKLVKSEFGCKVNGIYLGCLLYADDIILLSQSVTTMQKMLDICSQYAIEMDVKFNTGKSVAMRIGPRCNNLCESLQLSDNDLLYVDTIKYLGVYIKKAKKFCCTYEHCKLKFFRSFNAVYSRCKGINSELPCLELFKSFCLPVIMYAVEATWPSKTNINMLDNLINLAVKKIFNMKDYDMLATIRNNIGLHTVAQACDRKKLTFINKFVAVPMKQNNTILHMCFHDDVQPLFEAYSLTLCMPPRKV